MKFIRKHPDISVGSLDDEVINIDVLNEPEYISQFIKIHKKQIAEAELIDSEAASFYNKHKESKALAT